MQWTRALRVNWRTSYGQCTEKTSLSNQQSLNFMMFNQLVIKYTRWQDSLHTAEKCLSQPNRTKPKCFNCEWGLWYLALCTFFCMVATENDFFFRFIWETFTFSEFSLFFVWIHLFFVCVNSQVIITTFNANAASHSHARTKNKSRNFYFQKFLMRHYMLKLEKEMYIRNISLIFIWCLKFEQSFYWDTKNYNITKFCIISYFIGFQMGFITKSSHHVLRRLYLAFSRPSV